MIDAAVQDTVMQGNLQQNQDSYELAKLFTQELGFDHVFLTSSGAMANENALKIAFQKKQPATRILAFEGCFMGRTVMLSQITDKPEFREGLPSNMSIDYLPFYDPKQPEESTKRAVNCLRALLEHHPKQYAALCFESVQGEHGFYAGSELFFKTIIQECKHHGIAIIADEVQTFGRTQEILACKQFGVHDLVDIVSIGKMAHACATLWRKEFNPKPKLLSQTFTASTGAIRATLYMMRYLLKSDLYGVHGKNAKVFASFEEKLTKLNKQFPGQVEGPYGIGSMIAFTPCGGDAKEVAQFAQKLFHHGVIAFTAGSNPTRIRFLPPTPILEEHHIAHICDIVKQTFKEQLKDG
jgi:4-aminobutyrate aminotransferase-like enzyme